MMKESGSSAGEGPPKINIVINWTEELKQRVLLKQRFGLNLQVEAA